jgi:DNA invertase Pin-like site-specific DNA recombinase
MTVPPNARLYGYGRASTDKQVASPETQKQIIRDYAKRFGRDVDDFFIDPAVSGKKPLFEREAGKNLSLALKPGDHVIVARLDRLSRSFIGFAHILELFLKKKITMHLCDMPGGVFDPDNPMSELMIGVLIVFANYERRLISVRTREGLQARKARGERYCRWAEYGWRWEKRYDTRLKKHVNVKVPDSQERAILRKVVELRAAGHSFDQIRQHLNYQVKARTRLGGEWNTCRVGLLFRQGLRLMAETAAETTDATLALINGEANYDGITVLEDEQND